MAVSPPRSTLHRRAVYAAAGAVFVFLMLPLVVILPVSFTSASFITWVRPSVSAATFTMTSSRRTAAARDTSSTRITFTSFHRHASMRRAATSG